MTVYRLQTTEKYATMLKSSLAWNDFGCHKICKIITITM